MGVNARTLGIRLLAVAGLIAGSTVSAGGETPRDPEPAPVAGEVFGYRAESSRFGRFGAGTMRVNGPENVRGVSAYRLTFEFKGRIGLFGIEDRTHSWIGASSHASLRYEKRERSPLGSRREEVEIFPEEQRWNAANGLSGRTDCTRPLDELSFIYHLRTLPLEVGAEYVLAHHYDAERNPVRVRVLGREETQVPAGTFTTLVVEMTVRDERLSDREATMRFHLSDDAARVPVLIESQARWVGTTRLLLESIGAQP